MVTNSWTTGEARKAINDILDDVTEKMYGMDDIIRYCLVALYTDGHVLLEGNPGLGKTALVKRLAKVLGLDYGRIQFTPDLMPTDITGTYMPPLNASTAGPEIPDQASIAELVKATYEIAQKLTFVHGPIFTNLLLADEINRATPKTQSAMLEVMAERQVTVAGKTYTLNKKEKEPGTNEAWPFMVLATQNPIDHEGTYDLPEAQSDRFMFKLNMPIPDDKELSKILIKETGPMRSGVTALRPPDMPAAVAQYKTIKTTIRGNESTDSVELNPVLKKHINNIFLASNKKYHLLQNMNEKKGFTDKQKKYIGEFVQLMPYGLGPRAPIALTLGAKAWSLFFSNNQDPISYDAVARVAIPTLRHRVKLKYGWENEYKKIVKRPQWSNNDAQEHLLDQFIADFCLATAPQDNHDYISGYVTNTLDGVLGKL